MEKNNTNSVRLNLINTKEVNNFITTLNLPK